MTAKMIFKMEMFKFYKDKPYIIAAAILALLNIVVTSIAVNATGNFINSGFNMGSNANEAFLTTLVTVTPLLVIGNAVFMFVYPFHSVAVDYKNNVMAMLFASGVNRKNLYFAKVGAIVLSTILLSISISLIPIIILTVKLTNGVDFKEILDALSRFIEFIDTNFVSVLLLGILSYVNMVVMIVFASIFQKGAKLTFLVYVGLSMLVSMVKGVFNLIPLSMNISASGTLVFQIIWVIASLALFTFGSLKLLETQDL